MADRHVDTGWHALVQRFASIGTGGKVAALMDLLRRNPGEKKLVFAHYRDTLEHLADVLAREGFAFAFEGALSGPAKDAATADFRERVPVLLLAGRMMNDRALTSGRVVRVMAKATD